jgi:lipopolysaccharide transport system permease protein
MSAAYTEVSAVAGGRSVRVRLRIENRSAETWSVSGGFAIGTQFIDPETNAYVEDGPRAALTAEVPPGGAGETEILLEFPRQRGLYRVYVSPMREGAGWCYERGWPFLLLDVSVQEGAAVLVESRVVTMRRLRAEIFLRSLGRAFTYPVTGLWRFRSLIRSMVRRDLLARYRGSLGGLFWTLLNPLLLMLTYFFVFGVVLRTHFPGDPSRSGFVLYFLAGMLAWLPFNEAAGRAPSVIVEHRNFVKKVVFPLETLPVSLTAGGLVTQAFALAIFLVLLVVLRGTLPVAVLWLPALLVPQILFTLGVCWFLAGLGAYVRDLGQVNGFLLTLWFFLTPICYPETSLSPAQLQILSKNPLFVLVRGYRAILLDPGGAPAFSSLWKLWLLSAVVFILGHAWFYRLRKNFADVM